MDRIKLFVGCAPNHDDAESQAVLEYTARQNSTLPVEITWMKLSHDPESPFHGWETSGWATPFSGFRCAVPALCGWEGRAIYCDSDIIIMGDLADLWNRRIGNIPVVAKSNNRLCVSLWDCNNVPRWSIPELRRGYRPGIEVEEFRPNENWNCLDGEKYQSLFHPDIKAIHYTSMPHQPHLEYAIPRLQRAGSAHWFDGRVTQHWRDDLRSLFKVYLNMAEANGYSVDRYCIEPIYGPFPKLSNSSLNGGKPRWG